MPSRRTAIGIALLLVLHAALGIDAARRLTVTHDEYWHLPAGLLAWKTGRFDFDRLNPPLTRMCAALPLLATSAQVDPATDPADLTQLGDRFLDLNREGYERSFTLARSMNILWSLLTALILISWSQALFGERAALLTTALWCCCPTVLAHAGLVTPDIGGACLFAATLFATWRFARNPGWRGAVVVGLLLGLAQLAKFTDLLLYPLVPAVWFFVDRSRRAESARPSAGDTRGAAGAGPSEGPAEAAVVHAAPASPAVKWGLRNTSFAALIVLVSLVVLNGGYLFRGSFSRLEEYRFSSRAFSSLAESTGALGKLPVPLPRDYLLGIDSQRRMMEGRHPVYLDGRWSETGFGDYFIKSLAYKLPHATQLLLVAALLFVLFPGRVERDGWTQALLALPPALVLAVASGTGMQLGVRYLLPAFPFLFLLAGQAARWFDGARYPLRTVLVAILGLALPFSLRHHPQHLAYFNELSGGPLGGRDHLLDSNLDWGQDLRELKRYLDREQVDEIGLAYFGMVPPASVGIRYHLPALPPAPGWYAVSVNFLQGRPHTIRNPDGTMRSANIGEFTWFHAFSPTARIGSSIDVFHVTEEDLRGLAAPHAN